MNNTLDWRDLSPTPEIHHCDCGYCEMQGEPEDAAWPMLIVADGDGTDYITDRYMLIRADLAPIPDEYEGPVQRSGPSVSDLLASLAGISNAPPRGLRFRSSVIKALELTGWDLRLLNGSPGPLRRVAVVDRDRVPIGVVIASREDGSSWGDDDTVAYDEFLESRSAA